MKLLEVIPGKETRPEIVTFITRFCEQVLGEGRRYLQRRSEFHR